MKTPYLTLTVLLLTPLLSLHALEPLPAFAPGTRILFQGDSIIPNASRNWPWVTAAKPYIGLMQRMRR